MWHLDRIYRTLEHNWLKKNIYHGLKNLHDDIHDNFMDETLYFFSEADFSIVMQRCIKLEVGITCIKPRFKGRYYSVKGCDPYDRLTQVKIFKTFQSLNFDLHYAASYHVPTKLLKLENFFGFGKLRNGFEGVFG